MYLCELFVFLVSVRVPDLLYLDLIMFISSHHARAVSGASWSLTFSRSGEHNPALLWRSAIVVPSTNYSAVITRTLTYNLIIEVDSTTVRVSDFVLVWLTENSI